MKTLWLIVVTLLLSSLQTANAASQKGLLNEQEKAWIQQHPVINFTGDPDWLPFEGFDSDGKYIGIVSDILGIIQKRTGLKFRIFPTKSWSESIHLLETGKVDMLTVSDAWKDPSFLYTKSIIPSDIVIVMKKGHSYVDSLYYLPYETIAVIKGYRYTDQIKKKYPDYTFYEVENIQEGLNGVATGKYDVLLASMALASYTIANMQLDNVDIVGKTEFSIKIKFAVRKELAPLVEIINKTKIGEKDAHELLKNWTYQKYVEKTDYSLITNLAIFLFVLGLLAAILYFLLKRSSRLHKSTEADLNITQESINNASRYAAILDNPQQLESDDMDLFFDESFRIDNPRNIKSSTFTHFAILDNERAVVLMIDAHGDTIEGILNAMFLKTLIRQVISQVESNPQETNAADILTLMGTQLTHALNDIDPNNRPDNLGFDAAAVILDKNEAVMHYAGANIPLFYTQDHRVFSVRADKHSVSVKGNDFTDHTIHLSGTMDFYLLTRGYIDQTGGKQMLPFGKRRIKEIIGAHEDQDLNHIKNTLIKAFREHLGQHGRIGDITLLGFRISG